MTMDKATPDHNDLILNPVKHFTSPSDILLDDRLSVEQKRESLAAWESDARQLAIANEEGMTGGEPSRLDDVKQAQAKLPGEATSPAASPTKAG